MDVRASNQRGMPCQCAVFPAFATLGPKVALHQDRRFRPLRDMLKMPGVLALLEDAVLDHAPPVVGVEGHERVAHGAVGQVDRAPFGIGALTPPHDHDGVEGVPVEVLTMALTRMRRVAIAVVGGQRLHADQAGAPPHDHGLMGYYPCTTPQCNPTSRLRPPHHLEHPLVPY